MCSLDPPLSCKPEVCGAAAPAAAMAAETEAKKVIMGYLDDNRVMVFSKTYCPYCTKAKKALLSLLDASQLAVLEVGTTTPAATLVPR